MSGPRALSRLRNVIYTSVFLDAIRVVDYVRLQESIDPNRIGVIGRGFGASLAVFAAGLYQDRVHAVSL